MGLFAPAAIAQEVVAISAGGDRGRTSEDVLIQVNLRTTTQLVYCGLRVDFGNGAGQDIRIDSEGGLTQNLQARYTNPGRYTITAKGRTLVRGFKTLSSCSGEKSIVVTVVDPAVEQMRQDLERSRQELKDRQERETVRREEDLKRREAEAARREDEARQREAQARQVEAELRRKEEDGLRKALQDAERARVAAEKRRSSATTTAPAAALPAAPTAPRSPAQALPGF